MDQMIETGTFTHGMLCDGKYYKSFTLAEDTMRHTLMVANDTTLNYRRLAGDEKDGIEPDEAYYSACLLAKRLTVEGIDQVTPEMVESLSRVDGRQLLNLSAKLEDRRELFRKETEAPPEGPAGAAEAGLPGGGSPGDESGKDS